MRAVAYHLLLAAMLLLLGGCAGSLRPGHSHRLTVIPDGLAGLRPLSGKTSVAKPRVRADCVAPPSRKERLALKVGAVQLRGVKGRLWSTLHKRTELRAGQRYSNYRVREDVRRMWQAGVVRSVWVEACMAGSDIAVTYHVRASRRVRRIWIQVKHPSRKRWHQGSVDRLWKQRSGRLLHRRELQRDLRRLRDRYRRRGYWSARVVPYLRAVSPDVVDLVLRIRTGPRVVVGRVRFTGNRSVSAAALKKLLSTQKNGVYSESKLDRDLLRIQHHYYDRGHISVKVSTPRIVLGPQKQTLQITIAIREGKFYRLGRVDLRGELQQQQVAGKAVALRDPKSPVYQQLKKRLLKVIRSRSGAPFKRTRLQQDIQRLIRWYGNRGYAFANVWPRTRINVEKRRIDIDLMVTCGRRLVIDRIEVRGNHNVPALLIRSLVGLARGQRYHQQVVVAAQRRLMGLGLFRKVHMSRWMVSGTGRVKLVVKVVEKKRVR